MNQFKKLELNKETISTLSEFSSEAVHGGMAPGPTSATRTNCCYTAINCSDTCLGGHQ